MFNTASPSLSLFIYLSLDIYLYIYMNVYIFWLFSKKKTFNVAIRSKIVSISLFKHESSDAQQQKHMEF